MPSVHAAMYAEFPAEVHGGSLDLVGRIAAIAFEAFCALRGHTEDVVRIAFQGFENDSIFSEGLTRRGSITARGHWDALSRNGTPECLGTLVPLTAISYASTSCPMV